MIHYEDRVFNQPGFDASNVTRGWKCVPLISAWGAKLLINLALMGKDMFVAC